MSLEPVFLAIDSEIAHLDKYHPERGWDNLLVGLRAVSHQLNICMFTTSGKTALPMVRRAAGLICRYLRDEGRGWQVAAHGSKLSLPAFVSLFDFYARRISDCSAHGSRGDAFEGMMTVYSVLIAAMQQHGAPVANRPV